MVSYILYKSILILLLSEVVGKGHTDRNLSVELFSMIGGRGLLNKRNLGHEELEGDMMRELMKWNERLIGKYHK